jgi:hypothetical protein
VKRVTSQRHRFLASISSELVAQSTRVRDLIGDKHWLSDGHHKEFLLLSLLRRHLPACTIASRGFVISPVHPDTCSSEQDILIIDTTCEAPLFQQGDLAVCFPRTVLAAISVKTCFKRPEILDSIEGLNSVRNIARDTPDQRAIWCGAFFFESEDVFNKTPSKAYKQIRDGLALAPVQRPVVPPPHPFPTGPELFCANSDLIFRLDHDSERMPGDPSFGARIRGFQCPGIASALFVADLLDHIADRRGLPQADIVDFADAMEVETIEAEEAPNLRAEQ